MLRYRAMRRSGPKKRAKKASSAKKKASALRVYRTVARSLPTAEEREDRVLAAEARKALADPERIPYEQVRRDLGLD